LGGWNGEGGEGRPYYAWHLKRWLTASYANLLLPLRGRRVLYLIDYQSLCCHGDLCTPLLFV
jgi:hypothetical protein